jgi:hypothetical protein
VNSTTPANYISLTALDASATIANYASVFAAAISPTVTPTPVTGYTYSPTTGAVTVTAAGTYVYDFDVLVAEAGSLGLTVNGSIAANTTFGRATGTSQIVGHGLITLSAGDMVNLVNNNSSTALTLAPTSPQVAASFTLVALAAGTPGAPGANGTNGANGVVQGIATGTIANTATAGLGTASISGTAANPTININFPNDVQSVGFNSDNSATAGDGYVSNTGTTTNPILDVHFPADVQSVTKGTVTNSGSTGTLSIGGTATNPTIGINFPASSGGGATGGSPSGIPYTMTYHGPNSGNGGAPPPSVLLNPISTGTGIMASLGPTTSVFMPTACTPSATFWTYNPNISAGNPLTFTFYPVTPNTSATASPGWTLGTEITSCVMSTAATSSTPATCTMTASSPVSAGTWLTIEVSGDDTVIANNTSFYEVIQTFSCQ